MFDAVWFIIDPAFHPDHGPFDDDDIEGLVDDYNHEHGTNWRWDDDGSGVLVISDGWHDWPIGEIAQ